MSKEFEKWYDSRNHLDDYNYELAKESWTAAKEKILKLIEENTDYGYYEAPGGRIGFDTKFIDWKSLIKLKEEIEKL